MHSYPFVNLQQVKTTIWRVKVLFSNCTTFTKHAFIQMKPGNDTMEFYWVSIQHNLKSQDILWMNVRGFNRKEANNIPLFFGVFSSLPLL